MYDITSSIKLPIYEGDKINNLVKKHNKKNELDEIYLKKRLFITFKCKLLYNFLKYMNFKRFKSYKGTYNRRKERLKRNKNIIQKWGFNKK